MWRMFSFLTALFTFAGVFYIWGRLKDQDDDDYYYHYGDSLYRGDGNESLFYKDVQSKSEIKPETIVDEDNEEKSHMIH